MTAAQVPNLQLKWAFGFPNTVTAYSQPTVTGGRALVLYLLPEGKIEFTKS